MSLVIHSVMLGFLNGLKSLALPQYVPVCV